MVVSIHDRALWAACQRRRPSRATNITSYHYCCVWLGVRWVCLGVCRHSRPPGRSAQPRLRCVWVPQRRFCLRSHVRTLRVMCSRALRAKFTQRTGAARSCEHLFPTGLRGTAMFMAVAAVIVPLASTIHGAATMVVTTCCVPRGTCHSVRLGRQVSIACVVSSGKYGVIGCSVCGTCSTACVSFPDVQLVCCHGSHCTTAMGACKLRLPNLGCCLAPRWSVCLLSALYLTVCGAGARVPGLRSATFSVRGQLPAPACN